MEMPDVWVPFQVRVALVRGAPTADAGKLDQIEAEFRRLAEEEGGRVLDLFWHYACLESSEDPSALQLVGIVEARSQYPVYRSGSLSLEKYVRRPAAAENETPEALDPEAMAEAIQRSLNRSGRFLVVDLQRWHRASEFHGPEHSGRPHAEVPPNMWAYVVRGEASEKGDRC